MLFEAYLVDEMKKKLHKLFMVLVLHAVNPNFDHIGDQILTCQEVSSM